MTAVAGWNISSDSFDSLWWFAELVGARWTFRIFETSAGLVFSKQTIPHVQLSQLARPLWRNSWGSSSQMKNTWKPPANQKFGKGFLTQGVVRICWEINVVWFVWGSPTAPHSAIANPLFIIMFLIFQKWMYDSVWVNLHFWPTLNAYFWIYNIIKKKLIADVQFLLFHAKFPRFDCWTNASIPTFDVSTPNVWWLILVKSQVTMFDG